MHTHLLNLSWLSTVIAFALGAQVPLHKAQLSTASLSSQHIHLSHEDFPDHAVRIKKTEFCDNTVGVYTGYVDVDAKHLFFYFFESRNDPINDDIVLWINGGPGASSAMGLFMELGPCNVISKNATEFNPHSWNAHANMIFLDNPAGVGWSYAEYGQVVTDAHQAAKDVAAFFAILAKGFPEFQGKKLHLSGESYAGRYLPLFAAEIYDQNSRAQASGQKPPVNLASVMIGNGRTDVYSLQESYYAIQCTNVSGIGAIQTISKCVRMKQALPRCQKLLKTHCEEPFDEMNCRHAQNFCSEELIAPYIETGRNLYDITLECQDPEDGTPTTCWPEDALVAFLNQPHIRETLGIDSRFHGNFTSLDIKLNQDFVNSGDMLKASDKYVSALLERGVPVLIYAGAHDFICNWPGNHATADALDWTGQAHFKEKKLREWLVRGSPAGLTKSFGDLTLASIYAAGHLAPRDKPEESQEMVRRWLKGESL